MKACFIGHREIEKNEGLISLLTESVLTLINNGVKFFLFGSKSDFNDLAWEVVTKLKEKYPFIKRIYVRSAYQHISKDYEDYLLKDYEATYFPPEIEKAGKYSYVERNYNMIDCATYCVFYYNEKYLPPVKKQSKRDLFIPQRSSSGTKIAYEYAKRKNKKIINLFIQFN